MGLPIIGGIMQKQAADVQAQYLEQSAKRARAVGEIGAERDLMRGSQVAAMGTAAASASGLDIGQGSPTDVRTGTMATAALDAATHRYNAAMTAYGFETEAKMKRRAGELAIVSSVIGGAGQTAGFLSSVGAFSSKGDQLPVNFSGGTDEGPIVAPEEFNG